MKKRIATVISLLLVMTLLLSVIPALAKYIADFGKQSEITSEHFYFTSDLLKAGEIPEYEIFVGSTTSGGYSLGSVTPSSVTFSSLILGSVTPSSATFSSLTLGSVTSGSITFTLQNYIDDFRINQSEIAYQVTTDYGTLSQSSGTFAAGIKADTDVTLTYPLAWGAAPTKTITVTAKSTAPYKQELKARFILKKADAGLRYKIVDDAGSNHAALYIRTGDTAQTDLTIHWNKAQLLIDETNDYVVRGSLDSDKDSATISTINADTAAKIVFFKTDRAADYTRDWTGTGGTITIP